jgi:hypothetical protein
VGGKRRRATAVGLVRRADLEGTADRAGSEGFCRTLGLQGRELGPRIAGSARVIDAGELGSLMLRRKYGWQKRALELQSAFMRRVLGRRPGAMVTIEIIPRH